jgi:hypothetical protein
LKKRIPARQFDYFFDKQGWFLHLQCEWFWFFIAISKNIFLLLLANDRNGFGKPDLWLGKPDLMRQSWPEQRKPGILLIPRVMGYTEQQDRELLSWIKKVNRQ